MKITDGKETNCQYCCITIGLKSRNNYGKKHKHKLQQPRSSCDYLRPLVFIKLYRIHDRKKYLNRQYLNVHMTYNMEIDLEQTTQDVRNEDATIF